MVVCDGARLVQLLQLLCNPCCMRHERVLKRGLQLVGTLADHAGIQKDLLAAGALPVSCDFCKLFLI